MDIKVVALCVAVAIIAGFIHASIGMGYGMIAMASLTLFLPYNQAAAVVSANLLVLVTQISISLREYIDWKEIIWPALSLLIFKILGFILMMKLQSDVMRTALGAFLIAYSSMQLFEAKSLQIRGTKLQGIVLCGIGGLFGGVFNVSGPFASIYYQARYANDPKKYAANMNVVFVPSAIVAFIMHIGYGNFNLSGTVGSLVMATGILIAAHFGVSIIKLIRPKTMVRLGCIYIIIMGIIICISG